MGFFKKNNIQLDDEEELSVPMRLIFKMKKTLDILLIINLIMGLALIISVADSIFVRERNWDNHTNQVEQIVEHYCGNTPWLN